MNSTRSRLNEVDERFGEQSDATERPLVEVTLLLLLIDK